MIRLAIPAADSQCPTFVFTEPNAQNWRRRVNWRKALVSPSTSIGSPSAVPVPWASR